MRSRTLLLHVGMHKTASTSLQRFLFTHREELRARGVLYPMGHCIEPPHEAHHALAWTIRRRSGFVDQNRWRAALEVLHADPSPTVVLSSEDFEKFTAAEIEELGRYLEGFEVRVVQYARNAWGFLTSNYKHNILHTGMGENFRTFMFREAWRCDYAGRVRAWGQVFGEDRVSMRLFDSMRQRGGVVRDFLELVEPGLWAELADASGEPRLNLSLDDRAVRGVRALNLLAGVLRLDPSGRNPVASWKRRCAGRGRFGRVLAAVDRCLPGKFWAPADQDWLRPRVREWNDAFFPRYAPVEDRRYLEL